MSSCALPPLLALPYELRNAIYFHIFNPEPHLQLPLHSTSSTADPIAGILRPQYDKDDFVLSPSAIRHLRVLQTCSQIHNEAHLLAVSMTRFYVVADAAHPIYFSEQIAHVRPEKIQAIRDITLTARISKLRALNEAWCGLPFGNPSLDLDQLTIIPKRPDANYSAYAEIAYHSQAHTLASTFAETFKGLRNVKVVQVQNRGCFDDFYWGLVYKALIVRLWNWAGHSCGIRFELCGGDGQPGSQWFKVYLKDGAVEGNDVGLEMKRFLAEGEELDEPLVFGF